MTPWGATWGGGAMVKHNFVYFFREGLKNMSSHRLMSFTAISMTVGCLLIMGTFTLVAVNADAISHAPRSIAAAVNNILYRR